MTYLGDIFIILRILIGNPSFIKIIKEWPAERLKAFFLARSIISLSLPENLTKHGPEASQKPIPNFIFGAV